MKVLIDIPEKSIDMAKVCLLASADNEEQENEIERLCEKLKASDGPVSLDFDKLKEEFKQQLKQLYMAIALLTISSVGLNEEETSKSVATTCEV